MYIYIDMYIYIYIQMCIYIHMYIYMYTHVILIYISTIHINICIHVCNLQIVYAGIHTHTERDLNSDSAMFIVVIVF